MSNRNHTIAAAFTLTVATLSQASATESTPAAHLSFSIPAVIGAAYSDRSIATSPVEVRRQGGFTTAGAVQWRTAVPKAHEAKADTTIKLGAL